MTNPTLGASALPPIWARTDRFTSFAAFFDAVS